MASTTPSSAPDRRREEMRDFLRTRRARLTPADVGMPDAGRRRTPGLRREEVAVLAGVGVSWYTWLEQGRDIKVSGEVLDAIARALRLDAAEREHLYLLAGLNPPRAEAGPAVPITPELQRPLDAWSPRPAYVRDRHWNFVAINDAARAVFGFGDTDHNCLVSFFTNARYRDMHIEWAAAAPNVVARFRADAARYPDDPEFGRIAADMIAASPEFAELWPRHEVSSATQAVKGVRHPEAGEMVFEGTLLPLADRPGTHLVLQNPRPGTGTMERLERLMARRGLAAAS
ncbi:helix-turn-helix domain-containing protein [Actinomadura sp. LD22]|uniref:Helix-turn-helix domain-containing protein n=1 Tax=Actinomadura physcomitrii TaxID=2650748 RepID=A0A6I4MHH8_9ACTN|nr:helix-turn-helix transcriptional regulator [Actinomadura physcomitrii]MWA02287.1 helix-turn-helix domain-containing protein [Actinomadura physcomitrii]MWA03141.1 helix-turn-helix domain-containing protein [Actinomadura physcomitrii]